MDQGMHIGTTTLYQYMQWATYQTVKHWSLVLISNYKLEYLAVYGHASSEQCARGDQLSTHGQKFDPESLYEPV